VRTVLLHLLALSLLIAPPPPGPWQYQLQPSPEARYARTGGIDVGICWTRDGTCLQPRMYDIDLYALDGVTPNKAAVRAILAEGGYPVCYVDAGTWEDWRPDAGQFPVGILGRPNGWPGERWLDIRAVRVLLPIMARRVALCARAGFKAVEFDNVDGFDNDTGFPLTSAEQFRYDVALARIAHRFGLAVGLKNDYEQIKQLEPYYDFAVDESCYAYGECQLLKPFLAHGKPVYDVEYGGDPRRFCPYLERRHIAGIEKAPDLFAHPWRPCGWSGRGARGATPNGRRCRLWRSSWRMGSRRGTEGSRRWPASTSAWGLASASASWGRTGRGSPPPSA
jgi:hypothetical protein